MSYLTFSRHIIFVALIFAAVVSCTSPVKTKDSSALLQKQIEESENIKYIMEEDPSYGAAARWESKEVLDSLPLEINENLDRIVLNGGVGSISFDKEMTLSGKGSIRLECPSSTEKKNPTNRSYGSPEVVYTFDHEDLTQWNRLSMWVYADAPGYYNSFLSFRIYNDGEHIMPTPGRFEGEHCYDLRPGEWRHILWEIPDIYRDQVTGISASIMMMGETMSSTSKMRLYVDDIELQKVVADKTRGFDLRKDAIAYAHSGYRSGARKQALAQGIDASRFTIVNAKTGRIAYKGNATLTDGDFSVLDFSDFDKPGKYMIRVGNLTSNIFPIGDDAYLQTAWRGLNFFFSERCGFDQPGIHEPCHKDVLICHPDGRKIALAGGWHDAADLTQGPGNDCEAIAAMLELASVTKDKVLKKRALEEARWGLDWILKTRFGDGYRETGLIMGIWTDNIIGTKDDMSVEAKRDAETNFRCAGVLALAAGAYKDIDPVFARWCNNVAVEDFRFACEDIDENDTRVDYNAFAAESAMRLYNLTEERKYLDFAAEKTTVFLEALQFEPHSEWAMPLRGYFYEDASKTRPLAYYHQSHEHRPAEVLSLLLKAAPDHEDAALWKKACEAMADWYKSVSEVMAPYGLLPAAVYEIDNTDYSGMYHEGAQVGMPSLEEYNAQVKNGIRLSDSIYLRRFPVAYQFRGFNGVTLAKAKASFILAEVLDDKELEQIATRQVEWVLGFNPFASSTVFGDGYDYHQLYDAYAGDVVGAVPVGIETWENEDTPYWPTQVNATYKEIWTKSSALMMACVAELMKE